MQATLGVRGWVIVARRGWVIVMVYIARLASSLPRVTYEPGRA